MFRLAAYLFLICLALFAYVLGEVLIAVAADGANQEAQRAIAVLLIVSLALILVILFLLCLARAKDRLREERRLYRLAHGGDAAMRRQAAALLERLRSNKLTLGRCARICDILVRRKLPRDCIRLPFNVTRHPDPCIYSQLFLMANNQPVTWDNPNVEILLGGVPQDTYNLEASRTYQVTVGIENASPFFDAIGTQVQVNMLTFGIGQPTPTLIHSFTIDVPAATPFPGIPHTFPWTTPAVAGHYCIQVLIQHTTDINPANNEGWNNTVVKDVAPGQSFQLRIPIANPFGRDAKMARNENYRKELSSVSVNVDSYELKPADIPLQSAEALLQPRAAMWDARVVPSNMTIVPGTEGHVEFLATVPAAAAPGTNVAFNVSATVGQRPIGGVTIRLNVT